MGDIRMLCFEDKNNIFDKITPYRCTEEYARNYLNRICSAKISAFSYLNIEGSR